MNRIRLSLFTTALSLSLVLAGCGGAAGSAGNSASNPASQQSLAEEGSMDTSPQSSTQQQDAPTTLLVAAAASLEYSLADEIIPLFVEQYPHISVEGSYDSSGKLQTQIEEGMQADIFFSAATKQMNALKEAGLVDGDSVVELLENSIVLIAPSGTDSAISSFAEIVDARSIALGDPESVPVGQYAQEALTSLGIYEQVREKASFGTNVTEVLSWVAEGSADAGIVYATDAATTDKVQVLARAPEGSLADKVLYPVGIVAATPNREAAQLFVDFLSTPEVLAVFEKYGFTPNP